jgi:glycosyltransferase involved in cell wall biosynthesis
MVVANTFATDTRVRREASTLANSGFDVQVLCWDREGRRPAVERIDQCLVHNMKFGKTTVLVSSRLYYLMAALFFQAISFLWVIRTIAKTRALILHAHDFNTLLGCVAVRQLLKDRVHLVYDCHELTPGAYEEWYGSLVAGIVGRLESALISRVDAVVAANQAICNHLSQKTTVPVVAIYCCPATWEIPQTHQLDARRKLGLLPAFMVLFSGRARQDYDLAMILDAARDLKRDNPSDFKFVFTGPAETMAPLINTAVSEDIESLFDFRGWVPSEDLLSYYMASDLCFAVTRDIGPNTKVLTPIKLFDSMACGVPVVVRDGTLAAEITRKWGCGIIIQNARTRFSTELMRLKENPQLLRALGNAGKKAFLTEYNWDRMQARLLHLYTGLEFVGN